MFKKRNHWWRGPVPARWGALALVVWLFLGALRGADQHATVSMVGDAEAAKHGFEAAQYEVVDVYPFPGLQIVQLNLAVLSHYSYLVISENECLVVDPGRDIDRYIEAAKQRDAAIKAVYLTHSHADFVAGHIELARRFDVPIYVSGKAGAKYEHRAIQEGATIQVGKAIIKILETPGHTPDSTCGLVANADNADAPLALLSGDTLFIGSVGRPDLMGEGMAASTLASMMFDTWFGKLSLLPDSVWVLPAHGAGSLCGAHLSDEPTSTLGEQRTANPYFRYRDRGEFIAAVLQELPEAPQYFRHNAALNQTGPELVTWDVADLPRTAPDMSLTDAAAHYVVDLREATPYSQGHIPNSVNIGIRGRFETWVGIMVPWDASLVVCGDDDAQLREALQRLHRVGYKAECLRLQDWQAAGLDLSTNAMIAPRALHDTLQTTESPVIVDVRLPSEWMGLRIAQTVNIPLSHLSESSGKLDPRQALVTVCNSAYRSSMAVGVLQRLGFQQVSNLDGGSQAWIDAGLPVFQSRSESEPAVQPRREVQLADRISAAELNRLVMDLPGTFDLLDIRPPEHFGDYRLPGAVNVHVADVLDNPAYLTGAGPLILVDRDGSLAMMVAGILSQKTERPIKALYGGLQAYWNEADYGALATPQAMPSQGTRPAARPRTTTLPGGSGAPAPDAAPPKTARRSAGC